MPRVGNYWAAAVASAVLGAVGLALAPFSVVGVACGAAAFMTSVVTLGKLHLAPRVAELVGPRRAWLVGLCIFALLAGVVALVLAFAVIQPTRGGGFRYPPERGVF